MAFSDWDSYTALLNGLAAAKSNWSDATDFAGFDEKVRKSCPALVPNSGGYDDLLTRLDDSGDYGNKDALFGHLRIVILAEVANEQELGADWAGYWISKDRGGGRIYAGSRAATVSSWASMDAAADVEPAVSGVAPEQEFDQESGRWRRRSADGEFEFYHDGDGVWERVRDNRWSRHHDGAKKWLPYDKPSGTWLYENAWVPYERVGAPPAAGTAEPGSTLPAPGDKGEDLDVLAERLVAETLADLEEEVEPLTEEERAEAVAILRRDLEKERAQ
jgi:hypothetical protein